MKCLKCGKEISEGSYCNTCKDAMSKKSPMDYLKSLVNFILKPVKSFKELEIVLQIPKVSIIISAIIAGIMMIVTLIKTMLSSIFTKQLDYSTFKYKTVVSLDGLKDLNYLSLIGKNLLIFAAIIAGIAGIYYVMSLIFKKNANFFKMLTISSISLIPLIIGGMIISPLLGFIWSPLSITVAILSIIYSILIFMNLINSTLEFKDTDMKIYFNLICLTIISVSSYYIFINVVLGSLTTSISSLLK